MVMFSVFELKDWVKTESIVEIKNLMKKNNIDEVLNNKELISNIAKNSYGIKLTIVDGNLVASSFLSSSISAKIDIMDKLGNFEKSYFSKRVLTGVPDDNYVLFTQNKIVVEEDDLFKTSNYINGIYNIISIYILLLTKRDQLIVSI